jgi:hypothetical protein
MNIYQKLLEIQKKINGLGKDKSSFNFKYVTGSKVLEHIKPLMNELGLVLKQEVLSIENTRQDYPTKQGNKSEILSKVMMRFTWIDCETGEKDENLFGANGQNDWEKGLGSALTYAERYFLLKYFHIATDEDDIDNPNRVTNAPVQQVVESSALPFLNVATPEWTRAIELLSHGYLSKDGTQKECTIADLRKKFRISSENQKLLQEQVLA